MTYAFSPSLNDTAIASAILLVAGRCWRGARDSGRPVQPSLFITLTRHECGMLAPVFDSLMTLTESALGRSLRFGVGAEVSEDEHLLLGLLDGSKPRSACIDCPQGAAAVLDCAICSTRIMMGLAMPGPSGPGTAQ